MCHSIIDPSVVCPPVRKLFIQFMIIIETFLRTLQRRILQWMNEMNSVNYIKCGTLPFDSWAFKMCFHSIWMHDQMNEYWLCARQLFTPRISNSFARTIYFCCCCFFLANASKIINEDTKEQIELLHWKLRPTTPYHVHICIFIWRVW